MCVQSSWFPATFQSVPSRAEIRSTAEPSIPHLEVQMSITAQLPRWHHKLKCAERTRCFALRSCWAWDLGGELRQVLVLPTQLPEGTLPRIGLPTEQKSSGAPSRAACGVPRLDSTQPPSALFPEGWSSSQTQKTEQERELKKRNSSEILSYGSNFYCSLKWA